jgi:hypothetical protein
MSRVTKVEYAIFAAAAYRKDRTALVIPPAGWTERHESLAYGLSLSVFAKDNEIVISYAGTDGLDDVKVFAKGNELVISFRSADSGLDRLFDLVDWPAALGKMSSTIQRALRTTFRTLFDISLHPGCLI